MGNFIWHLYIQSAEMKSLLVVVALVFCFATTHIHATRRHRHHLRRSSLELETSTESLEKEAVVSAKKSEKPTPPAQLLARRTFPQLTGRQSLKEGAQTFDRDSFFSKLATTEDTDFCAALFPIGYITPKLLAFHHSPSKKTLTEVEKEVPEKGHWIFPLTAEKIRALAATTLADDEFAPDVTSSYLIEHPTHPCTSTVTAHMKALYTSPVLAVCALQMSGLSCTMASFDMQYYAVNDEEWTKRNNVGGNKHFGGRTSEQVLEDYRTHGMEAVQLLEEDHKTELSAEEALDIQKHIDEYGPCVGGLAAHGHAVIIDGFMFDDKSVPLAMFVRDPMNAIAFALPWSTAKAYTHHLCTFMHPL